MVIVLWVLTMVTFFLTTIAPSDPAGLWVGPRPKPGQLEKARKQLGLDKPAHVRYVIYLRNLTRGDFGISIRTRQPVTDELKRYFAATIELVTVAIIISLIVGIPLGIYTAFRREIPGRSCRQDLLTDGRGNPHLLVGNDVSTHLVQRFGDPAPPGADFKLCFSHQPGEIHNRFLPF